MVSGRNYLSFHKTWPWPRGSHVMGKAPGPRAPKTQPCGGNATSSSNYYSWDQLCAVTLFVRPASSCRTSEPFLLVTRMASHTGPDKAVSYRLLLPPGGTCRFRPPKPCCPVRWPLVTCGDVSTLR